MSRFTLTATNRTSLFETLSYLDPTRLWDVEWREKKSKRTIDQNSRLWGVLYKQLGDYIGYDVDEMHQKCGYKFLRYQKEVNGVVEEFIKSTTKLDTKEMAEYQDNISRWASELGVWIE